MFTLEQAYIYIGLRILGINFLFIKNKFLKLFSLPGILGIGFFLLLVFLPLYNEAPDGSMFYLTQKVEYIFSGNPNNIEIKEAGYYGEQNIIPTKQKQSLLFIESLSRTIVFNEKTNIPQEKNQLIIKFPDNTIYIVYPGSKVSINKFNNSYTINKEYGNVEYYQPNKNNQVQINNTNIKEQKNKSDFSLQYIIDDYENFETKYIINQAGGVIIMQPIYQKFSKKILDFANFLRPEKYTKNLQNYEQYKKLLGRKDIYKKYEKEDNWRNLILKQISKGRQETRFLQQTE